jgi:hypothetical protein
LLLLEKKRKEMGAEDESRDVDPTEDVDDSEVEIEERVK